MTVSVPWTCPTCARTLATPYCPECGERPRDARDLTLRGLLLQVLHAFTSVDGKVLGSFRCLLTRPGALSEAFVCGQRRAYIAPFQMFLLLNVAFFAIQSLTHANIFSSTLASHLYTQNWSEFAQRVVPRRVAALGTTLEAYSPLFDRAVVLHAKSLIILMVVPFALVLPLLFRRSGKPFAAHAVFALHTFAFLLVLFCVSLVVCAVDELTGGRGLESRTMDTVLTFFNLTVCALYLFIAIGTFYRSRGWVRSLQAIGLAFALALIVLGYRFTLFLLTLYTT